MPINDEVSIRGVREEASAVTEYAPICLGKETLHSRPQGFLVCLCEAPGPNTNGGQRAM